MFEDIFGCPNRWKSAGIRGWAYCWAAYHTQDSPITKNYPLLNVSHVEGEELLEINFPHEKID